MQSPFLGLLPGYLGVRVRATETILALEDRVYMMRMAMQKDRRLGPDDTNVGAASPNFFICKRKRLLSYYFLTRV